MQIFSSFINILSLTIIIFFSYDTYAKDTVYSLISNKPELSKFKEYLDKTGLAKILKIKKSYNWTIFAPSNEAFKNIPNELKEIILVDNFYSKSLFMDHILSSRTSSDDVSKIPKKEMTISNKTLQIQKTEDLFVKDMIVQQEDLTAENGIVHVINCIMFVQPSAQDIRLTDKQKKRFPITSCCMQTKNEALTWISNTEESF